MQHCYNRGCGQTFDPGKNTDESCRHHPGAPYFHDAYKGWSCCKKQSTDFTEFLNIKGCTLSKHSNVKPEEPEKPQTEKVAKEEVIEVRQPIKEAMVRPPIESLMRPVQATVAPALKEAIDSLKATEQKSREGTVSKTSGIQVGTACKNSGCTYSYQGSYEDFDDCLYHPGVPIFHEGMKYWSCCQRKTSDFATFMAQKGCCIGGHKWIKENYDKKVVNCRYDWHQTATNVIVSIYAKMYHYALSKIEVNPIRLHVQLVFPEQEDAKFDLDMELRGVIDVAETTAHMFGTKLEITMPKAEPGSWSKLDFPRDKLPPPRAIDEDNANASKQEQAADTDDAIDLDDIETLNTGLRLTELVSGKNGVNNPTSGGI